MRALSAQDVLEIWEMAVSAGPAERALAILERALPECSPERLAALPLGRRDGLLLELYDRTFGPELDLFVRCPSCGEDLELDVSAVDLLPDGESEIDALLRECAVVENGAEREGMDEPTLYDCVDGDLVLHFRLANSLDTTAAAQVQDSASAQQLLVERLVLEAWRDGEEIAVAELSAEELARFAAELLGADPGAEVVFDLKCRACQHRWQALCDIVECFWHQLTTASRHLLREVHALARSYGWREIDILALSAARRRAYLEILAGE